MKRIIVGEVMHESSSLAKYPTEEINFRQTLMWYEREDVFTLSKIGFRDYLTGIMEKGQEIGLEIVPTFCTFASPSGKISAKCFETLREKFFAGIDTSKPIDAFCLAFHGAGVSEATPDVEGTFLEEIREKFGKDIPIVMTLDPHANITEKMIQNATLLVPSKLYPHVDAYETGELAAQFTKLLLDRPGSLSMSVEKIPILLPITKGCTYTDPMKNVLDYCDSKEKIEGVKHSVFVQGFPYSDIKECGSAALVITENNPELAEELTKEIAAFVYDRREDFRSDCYSIKEGLDVAEDLIRQGESMIVINETSDNPGAGTPGDATWLLKELLKRNIEKSCIAAFNDPESAKKAIEAGVGNTVQLNIGGKTDDIHGEPITIAAYVKSICDGKYFLLSDMTHGQPVNFGDTVRVQIGNVDVIIASNGYQIMDDGILTLLGINFKEYNVICVKSAQHFKAYFQKFTKHIITVDSPGISTGNLETLPLKNVVRPVFPLDF